MDYRDIILKKGDILYCPPMKEVGFYVVMKRTPKTIILRRILKNDYHEPIQPINFYPDRVDIRKQVKFDVLDNGEYVSFVIHKVPMNFVKYSNLSN